MKSVKTAKTLYLIMSSLIGAAGLLMILFSQTGMLVCCQLVGIIFLLAGLCKQFCYFVDDPYSLAFQYDFAIGICMFFTGIAMLIHPNYIKTFFPFIAGTLVLVDGGFKIQTAIAAKDFGMRHWGIMSITAVICSLCGIVLMLIFQEFNTRSSILTGFALLADGLENLFYDLYTVKVMKETISFNE